MKVQSKYYTKIVSLSLRPTQLKQIKALATDQGQTLSSLIRKIIDNYLGGKNA